MFSCILLGKVYFKHTNVVALLKAGLVSGLQAKKSFTVFRSGLVQTLLYINQILHQYILLISDMPIDYCFL